MYIWIITSLSTTDIKTLSVKVIDVQDLNKDDSFAQRL